MVEATLDGTNMMVSFRVVPPVEELIKGKLHRVGPRYMGEIIYKCNGDLNTAQVFGEEICSFEDAEAALRDKRTLDGRDNLVGCMIEACRLIRATGE
jgi:hypothetical protein